MRRKFLNHHKIRRRFQRHFRRASDEALVYGYDGARVNPFRKEKKSGLWRLRLESFTLLLTVAMLVWLITSHSFFQINKVRVAGLQRIPESDVQDAIQSIFNHKIWAVFPGTSYMFVDAGDIQDILQHRFPLQSVTVNKLFPNELNVTVEEKISTIIYDNGRTFSYLGLDGQVVEVLRAVSDNEWQTRQETVTTTLADGTVRREDRVVSRWHVPLVTALQKQLGEYPLLYDQRNTVAEVNSQVVTPEIARHVIAWFELLRNRTTIPFDYILIADAPQIQATLVTAEGWHIKIPLLDDPAIPFMRLELIMKELPRPHLEYVDVRYPEKVYWK